MSNEAQVQYFDIRDVSFFRKHFYLGSANFGSRGTTFTKELGMLVKDCPSLGEDARKIFDLYKSVDGLNSLPKKYSKHLKTRINATHPITIYNTKDDVVYKVQGGDKKIFLQL